VEPEQGARSVIEWKEIPGYRGRYRISADGVVQTNHGGHWWALATPKDAHGYLLVYLWDSDKQQRVRRLVHQLVAQNFVPPVEGRTCVNHLDGHKLNNHFTNLQWTTRAGNMQHAWQTGLCRPHKLTESDVKEILRCGGTDTETAKRFGVSQVMVTRIRARKAWRHVDAT
jgi:hypothetical protein